MAVRTLSLLLAILAVVYSKDTTTLSYNVVAPEHSSCSINIAGQTLPMTNKWTGVNYFQIKLNTTTYNDTYTYTCDGTTETFTREWNLCKPSSTYNDFFGRAQTIDKLYQLGNPFDEWKRDSGDDGVFNDDYIPTIIFTAALNADVNQLFLDVANKSHFANLSMAFIARDDQEFWTTSVEVEIEDTSQLKPKMKVDLPDNWNKRSSYKLRPSAADPVNMRDKLYNDILEALGVPHSHAAFARVYVGTAGLGLYNLQESPTSKDFIKSQWWGNKNTTAPSPLGAYYNAATGADFTTNSSALDAFIPDKASTRAEITTFNAKAESLQTTEDLDDFTANWFDTDFFFRYLSMQYLAGSYDSYWFQSTNFAMYNDPTKSSSSVKFMWYYDQDFDQSLGINLNGVYNPYGLNYTSQPYNIYVGRTWGVIPYDAPHRTLVDKFLQNDKYKGLFETTLKTIVQQTYNPTALNPRIDALAARYKPEMTWDYGLGTSRAHQGRTGAYAFTFTIADYDNGLTAPATSTPLGDGNFTNTWGLKTFIAEMSNTVINQFGITVQNPPLAGNTSSCTIGNNGGSTSASGSTSAGSGSPTGSSPSASTASGNSNTNAASSFIPSLIVVAITLLISCAI